MCVCVSGLSTENILLKDMKLVAGDGMRVAVSSVFMSLEVLILIVLLINIIV